MLCACVTHLHDAHDESQQQRGGDRLGAYRRLGGIVASLSAVARRHQRDRASEQRVVAQLGHGILSSDGGAGASERDRTEPPHVVRVDQPRERLSRKLDEGRRSDCEELAVQLALVEGWLSRR